MLNLNRCSADNGSIFFVLGKNVSHNWGQKNFNFFQHMEKKLDVLLSKKKMFEYWTSSASTLKNEKSCIKKGG